MARHRPPGVPFRRALRAPLAGVPLALLAAGAGALAGCGQVRHQGDAGGTQVAVLVELDRGFIRGMRNRQWGATAKADASYGNSHGTVGATGIGYNLAATSVYLLGGEGPGQAQVFLQELHWGLNDFTVPLRRGHQLALTVESDGGHEGAESLGRITVPAHGQPRLAVVLTGQGTRVLMTPLATTAPAPASTPRSAALGAAAEAAATAETTKGSATAGAGAAGDQSPPPSTTATAHAIGLDQGAVAPSSGPVAPPEAPSAPQLPSSAVLPPSVAPGAGAQGGSGSR